MDGWYCDRVLVKDGGMSKLSVCAHGRRYGGCRLDIFPMITLGRCNVVDRHTILVVGVVFELEFERQLAWFTERMLRNGRDWEWKAADLDMRRIGFFYLLENNYG
jgi:hypothetical protein